MVFGFNKASNVISKVDKVQKIATNDLVQSTMRQYSLWVIIPMVILVLVILYLLYKSNKCACMPELTDLRDELLDTVIDTDRKLRGDIEREILSQQQEKEAEPDVMISTPYSSQYKPRLVNNSSSGHGYDISDQTNSVDEGGHQVTEISELKGDGFTVLDSSIITDVQNGVLDLDGGKSESWMMPGHGMDPMISTPVPQSRY